MIGLVDLAKTRFPNLALMKICACHRSLGDRTFLVEGDDLLKFDKVYVSCVFTENRWRAEGIKSLHPNVEIGGSGISLSSSLPNEVEHLMPDYSLYKLRYSMGFTSRGCIRKCPWCIVPEKEGWIKEWAPIQEFLAPYHSKLMLLDNNFLASPKCIEKLEWLAKRRRFLKVSFNQGLDIRLIDDERAELLSKIKYYDSDFNQRRLYFAWDDLRYEKQVLRGIETLLSHNIPPRHLRFYMLVGFNVTPEEYNWTYFKNHDYYRFNRLVSLGVEPYIMVYNDRRDIPILRYFARWVNRHLYTAWSFEEYDRGDSKKVIEKMKMR